MASNKLLTAVILRCWTLHHVQHFSSDASFNFVFLNSRLRFDTKALLAQHRCDFLARECLLVAPVDRLARCGVRRRSSASRLSR